MTVIVLQSVAIAIFVRWHSPRYFLGKGSLCGHFWLNWRITIFLDFFFVVFFVACSWRAEIWDGYLLFKVYVILSILIHTQVLCNFIRVANPRVKSFMQHLNCVSQQQYVLSLHIESTELCDANNVPLFRYLSHFVECLLGHQRSYVRHSVAKFHFDTEWRFVPLCLRLSSIWHALLVQTVLLITICRVFGRGLANTQNLQYEAIFVLYFVV